MIGGLLDSSVQAWLLVPAAAVVSALLILALRPLLFRYAIARPNARSSHTTPTPQGGGIAVVIAIILTVGVGSLWLPFGPALREFNLVAVFAATAALAVVGTYDDIRPIEAVPRLLLQAIAIVIVIASLSPSLRIVPFVPWWLERALILLAMLWFVNLVNFMDGIDWMTVAEVVPVAAALGLLGLAGALPGEATAVALALCGAVIGFAPFNRPVARLFLGDVGSLPIGLLIGWLLVLLAGSGHLVAALLLPLYYLADATVTLLRRLIQRQSVMKAHRTHYYQRAVDRGFTVYEIVARVFAVNLVLAGLAAATLADPAANTQLVALAAGVVLVTTLLWSFARGSR